MNTLKLGKTIVVIFWLSIFATASLAKAQASAWSRGIQLLPINYDECTRRAQGALETQGYSIQYRGGNNSSDSVTVGQKTIHTAIITCNTAPEGKTWVNIFVASQATDGNIPGAERVRLQQQMEPVATSAATPITWGTNAVGFRGKNGERFTFSCPANGSIGGSAWGTDSYTDDSSICTAAVHAGLISFVSGGVVTIEIRPGLSSYLGTPRNGITTGSWGGWGGTFVFVR